MPSMTEDLGRIAGGIAASRRERMKGTVDRHRAVVNRLHEIKTTRQTMSREQRRDAAAGRRSRVTDVEVLLRQFHRKREENAAAERARAAAFMSDLTARVAALRGAFRASQETRAASCHDFAKAMQDRLAGYRQDRHDASAAWRRTLVRHAPRSVSADAHRPAMEHHAARAETSHSAPAGMGPASPAPSLAEPASRPGRYRAPHGAPGEDTGTP